MNFPALGLLALLSLGLWGVLAALVLDPRAINPAFALACIGASTLSLAVLIARYATREE